MDWAAYLKDATPAIASYRKSQDDTAKGFSALHGAALAPGALDTKQKELIALSIGIAKQCLDCIGFHIRAAIKEGATREEVAETISVAVMMGGGPSMMYGAKALDCYDQLSEG